MHVTVLVVCDALLFLIYLFGVVAVLAAVYLLCVALGFGFAWLIDVVSLKRELSPGSVWGLGFAIGMLVLLFGGLAIFAFSRLCRCCIANIQSPEFIIPKSATQYDSVDSPSDEEKDTAITLDESTQ
jgi:hypothetical protein